MASVKPYLISVQSESRLSFNNVLCFFHQQLRISMKVSRVKKSVAYFVQLESHNDEKMP